ncbi:type II secretion system GspH family protein [Pseudomonas stutzeri]|uniref:PulJ/GspJ family protein n=1 Tax=Stutzerimonas stutzeri TaxID=316 RepID=UPI00210933B8|nr:type II secretion system protein [Stutzerimonas stutzeri]MCQ4309993.1 type II secretion system GspH family protein [Stutzerimonas stutzeri]
MKSARAFTLVELIMVIALSGIVLLMISSVMQRPLQAFVDQSRRSELVEQAAVALNRMARDIRLAVPNSIRQSSDAHTLETLNVVQAGRYVPNRAGGESLRFSSELSGCETANGRCDGFQVLDPDLSVKDARWLVINNLGATSDGEPTVGGNVWAYADPGVITPSGTTFSATSNGNETQITLGLPGGAFTFAYASAQRRFYLADQVIGYRCNPATSGGQLLRYTTANLSVSAPNAAPSGAVPVASNVTACSFAYQPGSPQRPGLVTMSLTLASDGEFITLQQQVHIDNAP